MNGKAILFRVAAICLPLMLLVAAEGFLRLTGVARDTREVFTAVPGQPDYLTINPRYALRYFHTFEPSIAFNPFLKSKGAETFRVFVLGGSTTAGFPYQFYHGFPGWLGTRLKAHAPDRHIEVINLGMTAVNSYTFWDLKHAVARAEPDAIIIYAGHNEYYGAFGAGSSVYALGNRRFLKRLTLRLKRTVLYTLAERLLAGGSQADAPPGVDRTMMARVVRDATIALDGRVYHAGIRQFEVNMESVLRTFRRRGVPVYVGTLTANLRDQSPLGEDSGALAAYDRGREHMMQGDTVRARRAFLEAVERDDIRFRAPGAMNDAIRRFAREANVTLVDIAAAFRNASQQGVEGSDLFTDHLHPNARGYARMADCFFEALRQHPRLMLPAEPGIAATASIDPVDEAHARLQIMRLKGGYPFDKVADAERQAERFRALLQENLASGRWADSLGAVLVTLKKTPPEVLLEATRLAQSRSDTLAALRSYRSLLYWQPFNASLMQEAIGFAHAHHACEPLVADLAQFAAHATGGIDYLNLLAAIRICQGWMTVAATLLARVEARDSTSKVMLFNKARLLVLQGDTTEARRYFERYRSAE